MVMVARREYLTAQNEFLLLILIPQSSDILLLLFAASPLYSLLDVILLKTTIVLFLDFHQQSSAWRDINKRSRRPDDQIKVKKL